MFSRLIEFYDKLIKISEKEEDVINSAVGSIKNIVAMRLAPNEDLIKGLLQVCQEHNIQNAIILSGLGSLNGARFYNPVVQPHKKAGYGYGELIEMEGPLELLALSGMICNNDDKLDPHIHFSVSDSEGRAYGGHVVEAKSLLTIDIVIGEVDKIQMGRSYDESLEVKIFNPIQL